MNVFDTVLAVRPEIDPMPAAERSRIREALFGVGHDDTTRSVRARSESGAVVSTAPHGTRAIMTRRRRRSVMSALKGVIGVVTTVAVGVVVWSLVSDDGEVDAPSETVAPAATEPAPSTTTPAPLRTPVTRAEPLLFPEEQLTTDEITIAPPAAGATSMLVAAPDDSTLWLSEFDGDPAPIDNVDFRIIGSVGVGIPRDQPADAAPSYQVLTPCGLVLVNDAPGAARDRPEAITLFESLSIDATATIGASLPDGFSIIDVGPWKAVYTVQFQVPGGDGGTDAVRLVQIPDGSMAQLAFGGRQLASVTFLGEPAFVDSAPGVTGLVSIYWQDASTVFNVSSTDMDADGLAAFVGSLVAASPDEWSERFATPGAPAPAPGSACTPQPSFGPTLNP